MFRTIPTSGWLAGAACLLLTASASAQLEPASWTEFLRLECCFPQDKWIGQDPASPEPLIHSYTSGSYSVESDLTFGPPGPPFINAHSEGSLYIPVYGAYRAEATTQGTVTFQLRIIEKASPPVAVEYVPLMIDAQGRAVVSANSYGSALASIVILNENTEIFRRTSYASTLGDTGPILLDATQAVSIQPRVLLTGSISVSSHVRLFTVGADPGATASVGPAFEITSDVIPGTASQYRDFFEIEYSPGYWALGDPTPVTPTTWGRIKSLYSDAR